MKRLLHFTILRTPILAVAFVTVGLSGCTSLRGGPEPVITSAHAQAVVKKFPIPEIIDTIDGESNKTAYRNKVLSAYFQAIDANYFEFRSRLGSENRQLAIGFDVVQVGLAGLATIAQKSAEELAAVSGAFAGSRGSIDKNLYFDQTTPALIAAMDSARLKVRTSIVLKMGNQIADYPLTAALVDLNEYQAAGTLDHAITVVTDEAVKERVNAKEQYENLVLFACTPEQSRDIDQLKKREISGIYFKIRDRSHAEADGTTAGRVARDDLEKIASVIGAKLPDGVDNISSKEEVTATLNNIIAAIGAVCDQNSFDAIYDKIKSDTDFAKYQ